MSEPIFRKYRKQCVVCGKWFDTEYNQATLCSDECKRLRVNANQRKRKKKESDKKKDDILATPQICAFCGQEFHAEKILKYCSKRCYNRQQKKNMGVVGDDDISAFCGSTVFESESERRKKRKQVKSIAEISREAREHGMDYGNYIAWLERNGK